MTLLVSWVGVDSRGPASIYIASDSRITWDTKTKFDFGRKIFGFKNYPDIIGYCGDVLFPSIIIGQIIDVADRGLLYKNETNSEQRFHTVRELVETSFKNYPSEITGVTNDVIKILFASREGRFGFRCYLLKWHKGGQWQYEKTDLPDHSDVLFSLGSGSLEFNERYKVYSGNKSLNQGTSRSVFHCFCDTLRNMKDPLCGGAPQLTGLYRKDNAQYFGVVYQNSPYLLGVKVNHLTNAGNIEWRNELFERFDPKDMVLMPNAQRQPNPLIH